MLALPWCPEDYNSYQPHPPGSLLIQSDLKLAQWLSSVTTLAATGEIAVPTSPDMPLKQNAFSHEVKFDVESTGSINPSWILREFTVNMSSTLFSTSRTRLHDLSITFGPASSDLKDTLSPTAQGLFLTSQFGTALSGITRSGATP